MIEFQQVAGIPYLTKLIENIRNGVKIIRNDDLLVYMIKQEFL